MKRVLLGLLGLAAMLALVVRLLPSEPVYSVPAVLDGLQRHPKQWVGRTILIHGVELGESYSNACALSSTRAIPSGRCRQTTWLSLGAPGDAGTVPGGIVVPVVAFSANASGAASSTGTTVVITSSAGGFNVGPTLTLRLRSGIDLPRASSSPRWISALRRLPVAGALFDKLFPRNAGVTVRMRLAPRICEPLMCDDGVVVAP